MKTLSSTEKDDFVLTGFTVSFQIMQKAGKAALAGESGALIGYSLSSGNSIQF